MTAQPKFDYDAVEALIKQHGIEVGKIYKTTINVENPKPDRRKTTDWRCRTWIDAGMRLVVTDTGYDLDDDRAFYNFEPAAHRFASLYRVPMHTGLFMELLTKGGLMPDYETLDDVLTAARYSIDAEGVLQRMIDAGKIALSDVQSVVDESIENERREIAEARARRQQQEEETE